MGRPIPCPSSLLRRTRSTWRFPPKPWSRRCSRQTVGTQIAGRVLEVHADAGQQVAKGALLMRIDGREAAEAARAAAAQYAMAKLNYERQRQLKEQKFVSQAAVDKAKADFDAAAANRSAAGASQSHASIVAPMAGIVARRHAEPGDMAMPGAPLFTIYQPGGLRVTASIPQPPSAGDARRDDGTRRIPGTRQMG